MWTPEHLIPKLESAFHQMLEPGSHSDRGALVRSNMLDYKAVSAPVHPSSPEPYLDNAVHILLATLYILHVKFSIFPKTGWWR